MSWSRSSSISSDMSGMTDNETNSTRSRSQSNDYSKPSQPYDSQLTRQQQRTSDEKRRDVEFQQRLQQDQQQEIADREQRRQIANRFIELTPEEQQQIDDLIVNQTNQVCKNAGQSSEICSNAQSELQKREMNNNSYITKSNAIRSYTGIPPKPKPAAGWFYGGKTRKQKRRRGGKSTKGRRGGATRKPKRRKATTKSRR